MPGATMCTVITAALLAPLVAASTAVADTGFETLDRISLNAFELRAEVGLGALAQR